MPRDRYVGNEPFDPRREELREIGDEWKESAKKKRRQNGKNTGGGRAFLMPYGYGSDLPLVLRPSRTIKKSPELQALLLRCIRATKGGEFAAFLEDADGKVRTDEDGYPLVVGIDRMIFRSGNAMTLYKQVRNLKEREHLPTEGGPDAALLTVSRRVRNSHALQRIFLECIHDTDGGESAEYSEDKQGRLVLEGVDPHDMNVLVAMDRFNQKVKAYRKKLWKAAQANDENDHGFLGGGR